MSKSACASSIKEPNVWRREEGDIDNVIKKKNREKPVTLKGAMQLLINRCR